MIDNFDQITNLIRNKSKDPKEFWFLQIIKRRKDNPGLSRDMKLIDNYFIKGALHLLEKKEDIIEKCKLNNARAYFRLNLRNWNKISLQLIRTIAENIVTGNSESNKNAILSVCGKYHSDLEKKWIIDLDGEQTHSVHPIISFTDELKPIGNKLIDIIPTVNGKHLIMKPFDLEAFKNNYPNISIHKDNPTLLYYNNET